MRKRRTRVLVWLRTNPGIKIVLFFAAVILVSSLVVFVVERRTNDGFVTFFDSLWWTIVTISTVGYGERLPYTVFGRLVAIGTIFLGVAMMGAVTGRIASFLMERQMKEEKGLLDHSGLRGHFIICGWKREMNQVLYEVLATNPELDPSDIVLMNKAVQDEVDTVRNDPRLKGIMYVNGDFIEERDLLRAGVRNASRILVLADYLTEGDLQQIDSKTVMAVMSIKNLNRKAYVCAELLDTKFEKYLRLSHCDEVLLSRDFSRSMLASASSGTGLSHVVKSLVSKQSATRIETVPLPENLIGKTYAELKSHFGAQPRMQLIGLLENTGNLTLRKRQALRDAQKNPDISTLIPDLRGIKTLTANDPIINPPDAYELKRYSRAVAIVGTTVAEAAEAA